MKQIYTVDHTVSEARLSVLRQRLHLAIISAALARELIARHRTRLAVERKTGADGAKGRKLLDILHEIRMLFLADIEALCAEIAELEKDEIAPSPKATLPSRRTAI
jgi:hypothetical protein